MNPEIFPIQQILSGIFEHSISTKHIFGAMIGILTILS